MNIKRLQTGDETILKKVIDNFSFKEKRSENIQKFLENTQNYFFVAFVNDSPAGYLQGYELQKPETEKPMFMIYDIEVLENYRQQGIGKGLIEEFKKICKENNGSEIFIPTNKSNIAAMKLYEKTGGKQEANDDVIFVYKI